MNISTAHAAASRIINELGRDHENVSRLLNLPGTQITALIQDKKPNFQAMADIMY